GGIIASMVVDRLLATLEESFLKKLEVYTFGSAANHMNGGHCLKHIEHFANESDFFASSGVMTYYQTARNKYDNMLYIDWGKTGHLLNMHYLDPEIAEHEMNMAYLNDNNMNIFAVGRPAERSHMATYLFGGGGNPVVNTTYGGA
ncbi:hypothetical protein BGZ99_001487, partial [Dissophora globulifera]